MKNSYSARLRDFEIEKKKLLYKDLTPAQYEQAIRKLAAKYGI